MLRGPFGEPRATVAKLRTPGIDATNRGLPFVKMLNLTFSSRKLFFCYKKITFSVPLHPTNKILQETSPDLSSFLGFRFKGRPIKLMMMISSTLSSCHEKALEALYV